MRSESERLVCSLDFGFTPAIVLSTSENMGSNLDDPIGGTRDRSAILIIMICTK